METVKVVDKDLEKKKVYEDLCLEFDTNGLVEKSKEIEKERLKIKQDKG